VGGSGDWLLHGWYILQYSQYQHFKALCREKIQVESIFMVPSPVEDYRKKKKIKK